MRLFVNVISLSVPSLFARDNKLYNSKRLNFHRLEACRNRAALSHLSNFKIPSLFFFLYLILPSIILLIKHLLSFQNKMCRY